MSVRSGRVALGAGLLLGLAFVYRPLLAGKVLAGRDIFRFFIPCSTFIAESLRRGELPLWIPFERLGQPLAAALSPRAFYPGALLPLLAAGPLRALTVEQVL